MDGSRRRFVGKVLAAGTSMLYGPGGMAAGSQPLAPVNLRAGSPTLTMADFTYLGAFQVPNTYPNGDSGFASGLTFRYVNSQLRFLSYYLNGAVTEFVPPSTLGTGGSVPSATFVRRWNNVTSGKSPSGYGLRGLHWDELDQRLYWVFSNAYNTAASAPSFGWSRLNDTDGTASGFGPYSFPSPPGYKAIKGMTAIPAAYRSRLGGYRLAAGFGGYESVMTAGPASMGPTLAAFDSQLLSTLGEGSTLPSSGVRVLVHHPHNGSPYTSPMRAKRNPNYLQTQDGWIPRSGIGYWTWTDSVAQSGVWIDTGTRQGFLVLVRQSMGGEQATVVNASPLGGLRYRMDLAGPLANVRVGETIACPIVSGIYPDVAATVVAADSTSVTVDLIATQAVPSPVARSSGTVYRGTFYYASTMYSTSGRIAAFVYDSDALLAGQAADTVAASTEFAWSVPGIPGQLPSWVDLGPGTVTGISFDASTKRLYVLIQKAVPFGDRFANAAVFVWRVA